MIVAVIAVRMVEPTVHNVIDVISVRHRLVTTTGAVHVAVAVMNVASARTSRRILFGHLEGVFFDTAVGILVMQVAVVNKIDVIAMADLGVTTALAMTMVVGFVA
jgi:hypothetical protein